MPSEEVVLQCSCSHLGHSVRFAYFPVNPGERASFEAYVDVMLHPEPSFWRRAKTAWWYLIKNVCGYGDCAECIVREVDLPKLRTWLDLAQADVAARKDAKHARAS